MPLQPLQPKPSFTQSIIANIRGIVALGGMMSMLFFFNGLQVLSIVLWPISRNGFRKLNTWLAGTWWGLTDLWGEKWWGIEVHISGDVLPEEENAMIVCNHQEMTDIVVLLRLARQQKMIANLKWFVKDVLKYVPGIGWGMLFLDCIFVKRNWQSDYVYIEKIFHKFKRYNIPVWVISFVEGTRMRLHKLQKSQEYATQNGRKPLNHCLLPRTKGFCATVNALREHFDAVYDITIGYHQGIPSLWQWCQGHVKQVNIHARRFPISNVPKDEAKLQDWLFQRYEEKDMLLDNLYRKGAFD